MSGPDMDLRDWFAGQALNGLLSDKSNRLTFVDVASGVNYTAHKRGQRFCSHSCAVRFRAAIKAEAIYTERTCPGCGIKWKSYPSNPSQYCSKKCIFDSGKWTHPEDRECDHCGTMFSSHYRKERAEWERFCSHACGTAPHELEDRTCENCGINYSINRNRPDRVCSWKCRNEFFIRDRSAHWKGGLIDQAERPFRRIDRDGYAAKYEGEHRLIAAREIGRQLRRGEVCMCIDGDNGNIAPANLFLCPSVSEFQMIRQGVVEWPTASNLATYCADGYVRPQVMIVTHDWATPRFSTNGSQFTRHPQADEIIKRRRAGANLRQLANDFGMSLSGMGNVVRNRL